ncbi:tripartite tricarboxylate transporter substrate binding protein [Hoeflea sp. CAU 1731]
MFKFSHGKHSIIGSFALAAALVLSASAAAKAEYPDDTIRIIVPWRAGGGTDSIARALAGPMEDVAGQPVLVENITGGAGNAGMLAVKDAVADGYTMLLNGSSDINAPIAFRDVPFSLDDYVCVGGVYDTPTWIISNSDKGYGDFADFVEAAQAAPGELSLGVTALASPDHVLAELLVEKYEIDVRIIPFNGGAPLKKAILANQVDAGVLIAPVMLSEVQEGLARVLVAGGSLGQISDSSLHNVATLQDHGVDATIGMVRGVFLPSNTPEEVRQKAIEIVGSAAASEAFAKFGTTFGFAPVWIPGDAFCDFMKTEGEIYSSMK